MKQLSTGQDSTLDNWIKLSTIVFGPDSPATEFLRKKADEMGLQDEVIADEGQLINVLLQLHTEGDAVG